MDESKPAIASVTIWAGVAVVASQGARLAFGYDLTPADQHLIVGDLQQLINIGSTLLSIAGGLVALWGRMRASKPIAGVVRRQN